MKRVRRDVWVTTDGREWLNQAEARQHDRWLRADVMLQEKTFSGMSHDSVVTMLVELLDEGKLIMPPAVPKQNRLL